MVGYALATRLGSTKMDSSGSSIASNEAYETSDHLVYPGDVDRVLLQHPAVVDAAVAEHEGSGIAFVVLVAGSEASDEELVEFCRERLAVHEVPSSIVFVERLPRSSVGKLLRHELRRIAVPEPPSVHVRAGFLPAACLVVRVDTGAVGGVRGRSRQAT